MAMSKRTLIRLGYGAIGLKGSKFPLTSDMIEDALNQLDGMMALWATAEGIRCGYAQSDPANSDPDQESGLPDVAWLAVWSNLALLIAPGVGKSPSVSTVTLAANSKAGLLSWCHSRVPEMQFPRTMPRGGGNKPYRHIGGEYFAGPQSELTIGQGTAVLLANGDALTVGDDEAGNILGS